MIFLSDSKILSFKASSKCNFKIMFREFPRLCSVPTGTLKRAQNNTAGSMAGEASAGERGLRSEQYSEMST